MSLTVTLVIMGLGALLVGASQFLERRARAGGGRTLYPVTVMLLLGGFLLLVPAGHLIALLTGADIGPRLRP